ncbi:MAG: hypothetical protein ACPGVI_04240 [Crocinitomicaceae bacterium]
MNTILDSTSKQYSIEGNELTISVKKAPILGRVLLYFITALTSLGPIAGIISSLASGSGFHISMFFGLVISGLIAFFLLRSSLWNTFGKETIIFNKNELIYSADYGWFKDKIKSLPITTELHFEVNPVGYEEDNKGTLIIFNSEDGFVCTAKVDVDELNRLIEELRIEFLG